MCWYSLYNYNMYKIVPNGFGLNASNILGFREKNFHGSRFNIIRKKKQKKETERFFSFKRIKQNVNENKKWVSLYSCNFL